MSEVVKEKSYFGTAETGLALPKILNDTILTPPPPPPCPTPHSPATNACVKQWLLLVQTLRGVWNN